MKKKAKEKIKWAVLEIIIQHSTSVIENLRASLKKSGKYMTVLAAAPWKTIAVIKTDQTGTDNKKLFHGMATFPLVC